MRRLHRALIHKVFLLREGWHAACHAAHMDIANPMYGIRRRRRVRFFVGGGALVMAALAVLAWRLGPALPVADRSSLWIDTV